ncbi:MAG: caspase family protein [Pseudonocardiaceae bacterium]
MTHVHAVLIGVNRYADPEIPDLSFARRDAEEFAELLKQSSFSSSIHTYPLLDCDATRARIIDLVGVRLPQIVESDDLVVFYFAGHGSPEIYPNLDKISRFLICHDTKRASLLASAIDIHTDLDRLSARLTARFVLFVLDACFSGYAGGRGITGPLLEEQRRLHRPRPRLEDLPLGSGIVFFAACADDEVARENSTLRHGLFSYHLLEQLRSPGASDLIGLATLYDLIYERVRHHSGGRQNPVLWGNVKGAGLPRLT